MSKYIKGKYKSKGYPSEYMKLRVLCSELHSLKELEYQDLELNHTQLEVINNKVNKLTQEIHSWWENKLDNMEHVPYD